MPSAFDGYLPDGYDDGDQSGTHAGSRHKDNRSSAHTPGPWEFGSGDDYYIRAESYPKAFPHHFKSDDLGDYLALVGNRTKDFGEANARLMAAAPDLLSALEAITDQLERIGDPRPGKDGPFIDDARAAIAKARWRDPQ